MTTLRFINLVSNVSGGRSRFDGQLVTYVKPVSTPNAGRGFVGIHVVEASDGTQFGAYGDELILEVE